MSDSNRISSSLLNQSRKQNEDCNVNNAVANEMLCTKIKVVKIMPVG